MMFGVNVAPPGPQEKDGGATTVAPSVSDVTGGGGSEVANSLSQLPEQRWPIVLRKEFLVSTSWECRRRRNTLFANTLPVC